MDQSDVTSEVVIQDLSTYQLVRDIPRRHCVMLAKFDDYVLNDDEIDEIAGYAYLITKDVGRPEPDSYQEALEDLDSDKWLLATDEEMKSLMKNHTWVLVDRVKTQKPIGCRWVFKRKSGIFGVERPKFKARLVAKGYSPKEGVDFQEIFSPVVKHVFILFLLSMVVYFDMELQHLDVKTTYSYSDEIIYMEQP